MIWRAHHLLSSPMCVGTQLSTFLHVQDLDSRQLLFARLRKIGFQLPSPHKSQKLISKIKLLQIVKVIVPNCQFMLSQLRLFDLAVIYNIADINFSISCKNKCYILIHLQNYLKNSNFTVKLTPSIYNNLLFFDQIFRY